VKIASSIETGSTAAKGVSAAHLHETAITTLSRTWKAPLKLGLTMRIVLFFVLLAAALLATVGVLSYRSASEGLKATVMSTMLAVTLEKEASLSGWLGQQVDDLGSLAAETDIEQETMEVISTAPATSEARAAHAALVQELQSHTNRVLSGYMELFIIDPKSGRVLASSNSTTEGRLKSGQLYFENGKTELYLQSPFYSAELQAPARFAGAPILGPDGELVAVLAARFDFRAMKTITDRRTGLYRTEDTYLVNAAKFLITQPRFISTPAVLHRLIDTAPVRDCVTGNSGALLTTDYRAVPVISVYRWIDKYQLCLLVEIDQAEALAPALALRRTVLWISLLALLITAALAMLLARTITRPLRRLHESVKRFAEKTSEELLPKSGGNELVLLFHAFSEMEIRVEHRTQDLASSVSLLNATLESTADGILTVRLSGEVTSHNSQYVAMWRIPSDMLERRNHHEILAYVASQARDPEEFLQRVEETFADPEEEAVDLLDLKDGRTIERYVKPQRIGGKTVGLVVNYRDITERKRVAAEIENIHKQLVEASRQAGKAEIATNVLHNVGNVLNSVNVSATLVMESITQSRVSGLAKATALMQEHTHDLGTYLTLDPRGKLLPAYLIQISEHLLADQKMSLKELKFLGQNIEHIKEIVAMQQTYAGASDAIENVNFRDLMDEALRVNMPSLPHDELHIVQEVDDIPMVRLDKHKILQILVNLMNNAKQACEASDRTHKQMTLRAGTNNGRVIIMVADNGVGIPSENLTKIFNHGFTTKENGHGFGLHSAALTAHQLGGSLHVQSDGIDQGATFTLDLPLEPQEARP
jgi:PAS domain S-box-containing protein